jgi:hypothetical protein
MMSSIEFPAECLFCQELIEHHGVADAGRGLLETLNTEDDAGVGSGDDERADIDDPA